MIRLKWNYLLNYKKLIRSMKPHYRYFKKMARGEAKFKQLYLWWLLPYSHRVIEKTALNYQGIVKDFVYIPRQIGTAPEYYNTKTDKPTYIVKCSCDGIRFAIIFDLEKIVKLMLDYKRDTYNYQLLEEYIVHLSYMLDKKGIKYDKSRMLLRGYRYKPPKEVYRRFNSCLLYYMNKINN